MDAQGLLTQDIAVGYARALSGGVAQVVRAAES